MLSISTDDTGFTTVQFDTAFRVEADWITVAEGIVTFADTLTVNISTDEVVVASHYRFGPSRIGFHDAEPVEQGVAPTGTPAEKIDALIAHLVARGDLRAGG